MGAAKGILGYPFDSGEFGVIYPPLVKDYVANDNIAFFYSLATVTQEDMWDQYAISRGEDPEGIRYEEAGTPFMQFFTATVQIYNQISEGAYFFLKKMLIPDIVNVDDGYKIMIVEEDNDDLDSIIILNEDNFINFQNALRSAMGHDEVKPPDPDESPIAARFKAKARYRDKIAAKSKQADSLTLDEIIVATCCMHQGITPLNVGELSYPGLMSLFDRLQKKEHYDIQVRAATSGFGGSMKGVKNWMKDNN